MAGWPRYDRDGNRHAGVRSEATVRGELRAIVAWVKIEDRIVAFPRYAILSGYIHGKNSGGHGGRPLGELDRLARRGGLAVTSRPSRPVSI